MGESLVHRAEITRQSQLIEIAREIGTEVMIEGLSHGLPADVAEYVRLVKSLCPDTPVTALGPLPIDVAAGYDHVAAAIGLTFATLAGLDLVNIITAKEHLAMPTENDIVDALRAARIGVNIAQVIREGRHEPRNRAMSEARNVLDWTSQASLSLFPELVEQVVKKEDLNDGKSCSICGNRCPLFLNQVISSQA